MGSPTRRVAVSLSAGRCAPPRRQRPRGRQPSRGPGYAAPPAHVAKQHEFFVRERVENAVFRLSDLVLPQDMHRTPSLLADRAILPES